MKQPSLLSYGGGGVYVTVPCWASPQESRRQV